MPAAALSALRARSLYSFSPLVLLPAACFSLPALAAPHMISGGSGHVQMLDGDGSVWVWGYNKYGTVGDGSTIEATPNAQTTPRKASLSGVVTIASGQGMLVFRAPK